MEISALIVDDEPAARRRLRTLLKNDPEVRLVGECGDGLSAATLIRTLQPALIFLDVQIPGADGFDVLEEIAGRDALPAVIFVTAHRQYALSAFEARAIDYLLKPFKRSRFFEVLARAKEYVVRTLEYQKRAGDSGLKPNPAQVGDLLLIRSNGRLIFLKLTELRWVEADGDYVRLHTNQNTLLIRDTLINLQRRLDRNGFIRIHRSTIVRIAEICEIQPLIGGDYVVLLRDKTQLTLSRRYRPALNELLGLQRVCLPTSS